MAIDKRRGTDMNQQAFNQIINAGEPVSISVELMDAAYENARRERTAALIRINQWIRKRTGATIAQINPFQSTQRFVSSAATAVSAMVGRKYATAPSPIVRIIAQP